MVKHEFQGNKVRNLAFSFSALLGSVTLTGCLGSGSDVVKPEACAALSGQTGNRIAPDAYPVGETQYFFDPVDASTYPVSAAKERTIINGDLAEDGTIEKLSDGRYVMTAPLLEVASHLNGLSTNGQEGNLGSNAAVSINTPELGLIGFTAGCISTVKIDNVPTISMLLPTNR